MLLKTINKKVINRPTTLLITSILSLSIATSAFAIEEQRTSSEIDPSTPILALDKLDSLKQVEPLEFSLPKIQHFTTDNGVPVSFVRTTQIPIVDVSIYFNAGSARDEEIRENGYGIAHMTAGMLAQGTKNYNEDEFASAIEMLGVGLSTAAYKDMFIISLRSLSDDDYLAPASKLMQEILAEPSFDSEILERNKARLQLGLQQQQQSPAYLANIAFMKSLYSDHPYAHPSTGTLESAPTITRDDLVRFKNKFLVANNATLAITGDLTLNEAKNIADNVTGVLAQGVKPATLPTPKPLDEGKRIDIPFDSTQTTIMIGQIGNARTNDVVEMQKQTNFNLGNSILAGGDFKARLMSEIRKNRGLTYGISGGMTPMQTNGPYIISFSTRQDKSEEAIEATMDIIEDTLEDGVTPEELAITKESAINSYPMGFTSNASINSTLGMMRFYDLSDDYLNGYLKRINLADLESVNTALSGTLQPDNFLIVTVGEQ